MGVRRVPRWSNLQQLTRSGHAAQAAQAGRVPARRLPFGLSEVRDLRLRRTGMPVHESTPMARFAGFEDLDSTRFSGFSTPLSSSQVSGYATPRSSSHFSGYATPRSSSHFSGYATPRSSSNFSGYATPRSSSHFSGYETPTRSDMDLSSYRAPANFRMTPTGSDMDISSSSVGTRSMYTPSFEYGRLPEPTAPYGTTPITAPDYVRYVFPRADFRAPYGTTPITARDSVRYVFPRADVRAPDTRGQIKPFTLSDDPGSRGSSSIELERYLGPGGANRPYMRTAYGGSRSSPGSSSIELERYLGPGGANRAYMRTEYGGRIVS